MTFHQPYRICYIAGDGIGPEVMKASLELLGSLPLNFSLSEAAAGYDCFLKQGTPLPQRTIQACREADAIFFGAVTTPPQIKNYRSPIIQLRQELGLFANVRPIFSLPLIRSRSGVDLIIVRENTEDLYCGREYRIQEGAIAERLITEEACLRILEYTFHLAQKQDRKKVTVVHKANVLRLTDGLFLELAEQVSSRYPEIEMEEMLVDSCAMKLILQPESFSLIVTTNMFGDILSDEAASLVGGLGVVPSANIGVKNALFEPVHGSAPELEGMKRCNPLASFFALAMMLEYLQEGKCADSIRRACMKTIEMGCLTPDLGGASSTEEVTQEVIRQRRADVSS